MLSGLQRASNLLGIASLGGSTHKGTAAKQPNAKRAGHATRRRRHPPPCQGAHSTFGSVGMVKSELSVTCPSGNCTSPDSILIPSVLPSSDPTSHTTRLLHALSSNRTRTGSPSFQRTGRGNSYSQLGSYLCSTTGLGP